jgi:hypothetical protein
MTATVAADRDAAILSLKPLIAKFAARVGYFASQHAVCDTGDLESAGGLAFRADLGYLKQHCLISESDLKIPALARTPRRSIIRRMPSRLHPIVQLFNPRRVRFLLIHEI